MKEDRLYTNEWMLDQRKVKNLRSIQIGLSSLNELTPSAIYWVVRSCLADQLYYSEGQREKVLHRVITCGTFDYVAAGKVLRIVQENLLRTKVLRVVQENFLRTTRLTLYLHDVHWRFAYSQRHHKKCKIMVFMLRHCWVLKPHEIFHKEKIIKAKRHEICNKLPYSKEYVGIKGESKDYV